MIRINSASSINNICNNKNLRNKLILNSNINNSNDQMTSVNNDSFVSYHKNSCNNNNKNDDAIDADNYSIDDHLKMKRTAFRASNLSLDQVKRTSLQEPKFIETSVDGIRNGYFLWITTPVAASFSLAIVIAALAGPQWLLTEEKFPNANFNGTTYFRNQDDDGGAFITKTTKSSLWILCSALKGIETYNCIKIDYFPKEEYRTDPVDSTLAIPYTVTKSCPFFLVSGIFLLMSFIVFLIPTVSTNQNILYYFSAGILFIISGLIMLIGLIVYISVFKAEVGSKLRPKSTLHPPLFKFSYGQSFFLYVFGFISTEFVGVLNIFLYISLQQIGHKRENFPCILNNKNYRKDDNNVEFGCNIHTGGQKDISLNSNEMNKRVDMTRTCGLHHSRNLAKSLNELYTEPAPTFSSFEYTNEFPSTPLAPLTRSVSTTTDIFTDTNSMTRKKNKKNQTSQSSRESLNDICGLSSSGISRGLKKTKDEIFNEFCKRANVRPKPKNIYYIDDDYAANEDRNVYVINGLNDESSDKKHQHFYRNPTNDLVFESKPNTNFANRCLHQNKIYPKSLFDLDMQHNSNYWNKTLPDYFHKTKLLDSNIYHSRTLPKSFMKRNSEFFIDNGFNTTKFDPNRNEFMRKSCENINFFNNNNNTTNPVIQWPAVIPGSPSNYSLRSFNRNRAQFNHQYSNRNLRQYGYDEGIDEVEAFDLDELEIVRRKSHASLFGDNGFYDIINGTAV